MRSRKGYAFLGFILVMVALCVTGFALQKHLVQEFKDIIPTVTERAVSDKVPEADYDSESSAYVSENDGATQSQKDAVQDATIYVQHTHMSRQAVYDQLVNYDNYSSEDAQYAVDHLNFDWNVMALENVKEYLEYTSLSEAGLYEQLVSAYEQFTPEEAQYAVANAGADWNAEALEAAESYYTNAGLTENAQIYEQLTSVYDQFKPEQAQYAIDHLDRAKLDAK